MLQNYQIALTQPTINKLRFNHQARIIGRRINMKTLFSLLVLGAIIATPLRADVPRKINYQGKLTDILGEPVNASAEITFAIYTESTAGEAIWSEVQAVTVTDGIFNVMLGLYNPLEPEFFSESGVTFLGVKVGNDEEMIPRQEIVSGAYALRSNSSQIADVAQNLTESGRTALLPSVYPIGAIYISTVGTNPADLFGFGTWVPLGEGRVLVGKADSGTFATAGATGGVEDVTLTAAQSGLPAHNHAQNAHTHGFSSNASATYGVAFMTNSGAHIGSGTGAMLKEGYASINNATASNIATAAQNASSPHTNLQPYIVVYMWQRTN